MEPLTRGFLLIEKTGVGDFPIGSLLKIGEKWVLWRDISSTKHFFRKKDYEALAVDDVVVQYLQQNGCDTVTYYVKDKHQTYSTSFTNFIKARPKKMSGRLQRFVPTILFSVESGEQTQPRPEEKIIINCDED